MSLLWYVPCLTEHLNRIQVCALVRTCTWARLYVYGGERQRFLFSIFVKERKKKRNLREMRSFASFGSIDCVSNKHLVCVLCSLQDVSRMSADEGAHAHVRSGDAPMYVYESTVHCANVLLSLEDQRRQDILCDVTVVVEGTEIRAHRAVLAASSRYFLQVLLGHTHPEQEPIISLSDKVGNDQSCTCICMSNSP